MRIRVQSAIDLTQKSIYMTVMLCCHPLGDLGGNSGVSLVDLSFPFLYF